ncbi:MAG: HlyD family efflux transporter periplasmic adaptor subunit [Chloroflexi bacterium]|nr:HlyD family efflux transporter periplasmic adaptor subunit [Chloroflexota bacterium]
MKKWFIGLVTVATLVVILASFIPLFEQKSTEPVATEAPAVVAPIMTGTIAEANLWPKKDVSLGFRSSGIIAEVNVQVGDVVKSGDVLAVLQGEEQYDLAYAEATLSLKQAEKDLKALQDGYESSKALAELEVLKAQDVLDEMKRDFEPYEKPTFRTELDNANKAARDKYKDVKDAQELVDDVADLSRESDRRIKVEDDFVTVRQAYDELLRDYQKLLNEQATAKANVSSAEAALKDAQREVEELADGPKQEELDVINQQIDAAKSAQSNAEKNIALMKIIAPFDGVVTRVDVEVGELAAAGETLILLVDPSEMVLKTVDLSETDMSKVKVGNTVTVVFDAYPEKELTGVVTKVTNWSDKYLGEVVYPVEIKLNPNSLNLLWGMTATVTFD